MALKLYDDTNFTNIANAIRSKNSLATLYKPREMAAAINALVTASDVLPTKNLVGASPLRFTDGGTGGKYTSAKVLIRPIQSGTGDPSPSNKRPVIEAERIKAYYRGSDNQSYTSSWIVEDLPIYGYRDLITGITENLCDYNEDNIRLSNWSPSIVLYSDSGKNIFYLNENTSYNIVAAESLLLVDPVEDINDALANMPNNSIASPKGVSIGQVGLFIRADSYSSVADLLTAIGTDKIYFLKSSPVITTSTDVLTILTEYGVNSIKAELYNWNESPNALAEPDLDITYQADPTLYTQGVIMDMLPQDQVSGSVANFPDGSNGYPIVEGIFGIVPNQEGTGDPSPSNIRPISGYTGMDVIRSGKNLFTSTNETVETFLRQDGTLQQNTASVNWILSDYIRVPQNTQLTFNPNTTGGASAYFGFYDKDKNLISTSVSTTQTFTTPVNCVFMRLSYRSSSYDIQLEKGSTATSYEAYQTPTIKSVTWADSAGTVYGGELNLTTGVLTVNRLLRTFNSDNSGWQEYASNNDIIIFRRGNAVDSIKDQNNQISNLFKFNASANQLTSNTPNSFVQGTSRHLFVQVAKSDFADLNTFLTFLGNNNLKYIYDIAPITYQLTPQELTTLLGTNNIYCDTGDSDIKYRADIDLYIQKKIAEG